jgi:phosphopantothenoylcysteine synthetase/decarboxylase
MGYEIAAAFQRRGFRVLLISGPSSLAVPDGVDFLPVETAAEMHRAVEQSIGHMDIAVFAAAVADYTPKSPSTRKIKKHGDELVLELVRTADCLGSAREPFGFLGTLVGFAAETENLEAHAREKLERKRCDLVLANDVSKPGIGFESEQNEILLVYPEHSIPLPRDTKQHLAMHLAEAIHDLHLSLHQTNHP